MTTVLDTKLLPKVLAVLEKYGRTVTITIETKTKNWTTGLIETSTATHSVKCSPPEPLDVRYVPGDVIQHGDMVTLFAAQDLPRLRTLDSDTHNGASHTHDTDDRIIAQDHLFVGFAR